MMGSFIVVRVRTPATTDLPLTRWGPTPAFPEGRNAQKALGENGRGAGWVNERRKMLRLYTRGAGSGNDA
ncbi:MAG: hypothetical protein HGA53_01855 [Anaerolineaceae bacterium]|nr:hypothetical protein [Anaerolineaceae bacterium]